MSNCNTCNMRKGLADLLNDLQDNNIFLLHNDLFGYQVHNGLNCGVTEPLTVTLAAGLASQGKVAVIYSVGGFVLYRGFDQIRFYLSKSNLKGTIVFCNAGGGKAVNAYPEFMGESHRIRDDLMLWQSHGFSKQDFFEPETEQDFKGDLLYTLRHQGVFFIRLGLEK